MPKLIWIVLFGLMSAPSLGESIVIDDEPSGFIIEPQVELQPDADGFVVSREVTLPAFERGVYFRPFSGGAAAGNRVDAVAFTSLADLQNYRPSATRAKRKSIQNGQFMLLKISDTRYLAVLPMVSDQAYARLYLENERLLLKSGSFGTQPVTGDLPLLIWADGPSPYAATRAAWAKAIDSGFVATDWRSNKTYPEVYDYLGWCSWEFYKFKISEKVITDAVHTLETSGAPVRWLIVDDGYFHHENNRLIDFSPDAKKFPRGWEPITRLKHPDRIRWMGIWRNTAGYALGISPQHTMTDLEGHLITAPSTVDTPRGPSLVPKPDPASAALFYNKMIQDGVDHGFDFTKVDFQFKMFEFYDQTDNAVQAARYNNLALEEACHNLDVPLLNCIAQPNVNSFQTRYSALTRSSTDYNQEDKDRNKQSTYQSFANHLWMAQTVWCDMDMFHSHDERDVVPMAIARAISGGPVYISDEPSKIDPAVLRRFCLQDGKLLRTRAPATLLPEGFFIEPFAGNDPIRVIAPLDDGVAAIALFNFTESGDPIDAWLSTDDYPHAGELLQPDATPWPVPDAGLLVYDGEAKEVFALADRVTMPVKTFGAKLFLLYPKTHGWAVIGRTDKYLPAAAVKVEA